MKRMQGFQVAHQQVADSFGIHNTENDRAVSASISTYDRPFAESKQAKDHHTADRLTAP
jgi:hypothetical protein